MLARRLFDVAADDEVPAVRIELRPVRIRGDRLQAEPGQAELVRRRRQLGDEVAAGVDVGEEAGRGQILGNGDAADGVVALDDQHL